MKQIAMLAGAAALAVAGAAVAKPPVGSEPGKGRAGDVNARAMYEMSGNGPIQGYGVGGCPPGLAKKAVRCVPPGQVRIGQRLPAGLAAPVAYSRIPANVRTQYGLSPYSSYYYGDGRLYLVNPRTMQVVQMLNARMR